MYMYMYMCLWALEAMTEWRGHAPAWAACPVASWTATPAMRLRRCGSVVSDDEGAVRPPCHEAPSQRVPYRLPELYERSKPPCMCVCMHVCVYVYVFMDVCVYMYMVPELCERSKPPCLRL